MSVLVTIRVPADTEKFARWLETSGEFLAATSATAKAAGCIHHQFSVGDGFVMIVDEWKDAESFTEFFGNPAIGEAMADSGAQGEPEISFADTVETPDRF